MEHFADALLNRKYDINKEILALEKLFKDYGGSTNISDRVHRNFLRWRHRNNFVDFKTFFEDKGLKIIVEKSVTGTVTLDEFIYYCEYMLSILNVPDVGSCINSFYIRDNIENILEKLNYIEHRFDGLYHIVKKDILVSEAADIVKDNYDLGEGIYSFNYHEVKGDLNRKSDILCRLYKYVESITSSAKQYGYSALLNDIKDLSNKLDIRHNANIKQEDVIKAMGKKEYELWLDELFRLSLTLIVLVDYTSKRKDINELKAKLG